MFLIAVCAHSLILDWLFATLWKIALQVPLSMEFSRQEYRRGCHFLLQGSSQPRDRTCVSYVSCIASRFFIPEPSGKPCSYLYVFFLWLWTIRINKLFLERWTLILSLIFQSSKQLNIRRYQLLCRQSLKNMEFIMAFITTWCYFYNPNSKLW